MKIRRAKDPDYNAWCLYLCLGQMFTALSVSESGVVGVGFALAGLLLDIAAIMCLIDFEK